MKTREIQEAFRNGNLNEKKLMQILCVQNEKLEAIMDNQNALARSLATLSNVLEVQMHVHEGMQTMVDRMRVKLGLHDDKTAMSSEDIEGKVHVPGS